jgi:hypothetical protein
MQLAMRSPTGQIQSEGEKEMTKKSSVKKGSKLGAVKPLKSPLKHGGI